ncbi:hypothetical protein HYU95_05685 [Candidatus Daviesbacteria bacterium]|nr:hypothetical protein [Candidatus Daviesbacteria bacterium]
MSDGPNTEKAQLSTGKETVYPSDLVTAITEARRFNRGLEVEPAFASMILVSHYEVAVNSLKKSAPDKDYRTAEEGALYYAVRGMFSDTADFLEVALLDPQLGGAISAEKMYALLALAYERAIAWRADMNLANLSAYGIKKSPDALLDERNLFSRQSALFKAKAGDAYTEISNVANSPKFAQFVP